MKTILYYFSGTGNSLRMARAIARELGGDADVVSMVKATGEKAPGGAGCVGFVFPVYMWGVPLAVARFLKGFSGGEGKYAFAVATFGGSPGTTLAQAAALLEANGTRLAAGFGVAMPGNYTPMYGAITQKKQQKIFTRADEKVRVIAQTVREMKQAKIEKSNFFINWFLSGLFYPLCSPRIPAMDNRFWVDEKCDGCGTCARICPAGNIAMDNGRPSWLHRCEQCMACLQWCPKEALQHGKNTSGRKRYRHPDITLQDMMQSKA